MTNQQKQHLKQQIEKGKIQAAIQDLNRFCTNTHLESKATAIAARYRSLQRKEMQGILSAADATVQQNQITQSLLTLLHQEDDPAAAIIPTSTGLGNKKWVVILGILGSIASIIGLRSGFFSVDEDPQLTIFVTDTKGNVAIELEGELNTSIGNRPLNEPIGANGRTNFGDILPQHLGDSITIGLKAEGWELVHPNNRFAFTGAPIHLEVKRDDSLGWVKGSVLSRDGQSFLAGAEIRINSDTIIDTDARGNFKVLLPESMRVKKVTDGYQLTVSAEGYRTKTEQYYPKSSAAEVRLEKQ